MSAVSNSPRLVIAGLAGDSGKSVVSMALLRALREAGTEVRAFKKGPDYIDTAWLSWASGMPARNLDSWLMGFPRLVQSFCAHATAQGINIVEGNRGLFDGVDVAGTHSTAELAKAIQAPVVLVLNVTKMTRTAAAVVLGCQRLDPDLRIAGVIVNHVASKRHETVLRDAIERVCGIPVVGVIPKLDSRGSAPAAPRARHSRRSPRGEGAARGVGQDCRAARLSANPPRSPPGWMHFARRTCLRQSGSRAMNARQEPKSRVLGQRPQSGSPWFAMLRSAFITRKT